MTINTNPKWQALADASRAYREANDCTVKALAIACDMTYAEAHEILKAKGRRNGRGPSWIQYQKALLTCADIQTIRLESRTVRTAERELARKYPGTRIILNVRGHTLAWDGSAIVDWTKGSRRRINEAWLVQPHDKPSLSKPAVRRLDRIASLSVWDMMGIKV